MSEPIKTTVVRYKCPFCNRHHSRKRAAEDHVARCWLDPAKRTCRTCQHHVEGHSSSSADWCYPGRPCDCSDVGEDCEAGAEPESFPVIGCALWQLRGSGVST